MGSLGVDVDGGPVVAVVLGDVVVGSLAGKRQPEPTPASLNLFRRVYVSYASPPWHTYSEPISLTAGHCAAVRRG